MGLFSSNYNYLGINLGASSIKLVELANEKGVPKLVTYAFTDQSVNIIMDDSKEAINKTANILRQLCKEAKITSNKVITALPTFSVFSSVISLPQMKKKDLASAVKWEAKKIIPMPIDEISIDWHILNEDKDKNFVKKKKGAFLGNNKEDKELKNNNSSHESDYSGAQADSKDVLNGKKQDNQESKDIKIFLTGAPKNLVKKYMTIFEMAELDLLSLETEVFALIRSLVGNDKSTLMIIDIGFSSSSISIVQNGFPIINRSIEIGGRNITDAISKNLNVSFDRGEQFKYDIGVNRVNQEGSAVFQSIDKVVAPIIDEVKYTTDFFKNQLSIGQPTDNNDDNIEKIILTGGSSQLSYLPEYLSNILNKKVYIGDPWARVIYPQDLKMVFEDIGSKLSVAVGLAMREIE